MKTFFRFHHHQKYISGDNDEELSCYSEYGNNSIRQKWSINLNEGENFNDNSWFRCTFVEEFSSIVRFQTAIADAFKHKLAIFSLQKGA